METTTLVAFLLRTPRNVTSVHLLGSWDNFHKPYPMRKDTNLGSGHWRGCHSFTDIICDGDPTRAVEGKRDGGLLMGGRYWYFYQLDDDIEYHDPSKPSTTGCPFLPGQVVNILDVPVQVLSEEDRNASQSANCCSFAQYTMDPEDKYRKLRPPKPASRRLEHIAKGNHSICPKVSKDAADTVPITEMQSSAWQSPFLDLPSNSSLPPKDHRPSTAPAPKRPAWPAFQNLRRCLSAGNHRKDGIRHVVKSSLRPGYDPSIGSSDFELPSSSPTIQSYYRSETRPFNKNSWEEDLIQSNVDMIQFYTEEENPKQLESEPEDSDSPHSAAESWLVIDPEDNETALAGDSEVTDAVLARFGQLHVGGDNTGDSGNNHVYKRNAFAHDMTNEPNSTLEGTNADQVMAEEEMEAAMVDDAVRELSNLGSLHQSSSVSSARTSGLFSSLSSGGYMGGYMTPSHMSRPLTPIACEPSAFVLETSYASPPQSVAEEKRRYGDLGVFDGFHGYNIPEAEHSSVLTIKNLAEGTHHHHADSPHGELMAYEAKSRKEIVEAWNDGSGEQRRTALQELVDDLGYLGAMIA